MEIKLKKTDIGGENVLDNEVYRVQDNRSLQRLVLSSTRLYRGQSTRGHRHPGQEEIYFFVSGYGQMIVGNEDSDPFDVRSGDVILIPDGAFHRVINTGDLDMLFNCVFDGQRNH